MCTHLPSFFLHNRAYSQHNRFVYPSYIETIILLHVHTIEMALRNSRFVRMECVQNSAPFNPMLPLYGIIEIESLCALGYAKKSF